MRNKLIIGVALVVSTALLGASGASAASKTICFNINTNAKKVVKASACPKGYTKVNPAKQAWDDIQVSSAWFKAMDTAMPMDGKYMSAAFMMITNLSDKDITLIGGSAAFAGEVQVHEVVNGKMRMLEGGLKIKAGTTEQLKPGGNHVMFIYMPKKLLAGDEAVFMLKFADGRQVKVTTPVKASNAGSETYKPQSSM